jgi:D-alanyl-D-alanine carboxypeptidase
VALKNKDSRKKVSICNTAHPTTTTINTITTNHHQSPPIIQHTPTKATEPVIAAKITTTRERNTLLSPKRGITSLSQESPNHAIPKGREKHHFSLPSKHNK